MSTLLSFSPQQRTLLSAQIREWHWKRVTVKKSCPSATQPQKKKCRGPDISLGRVSIGDSLSTGICYCSCRSWCCGPQVHTGPSSASSWNLPRALIRSPFRGPQGWHLELPGRGREGDGKILQRGAWWTVSSLKQKRLGQGPYLPENQQGPGLGIHSCIP